MGTLRSGDSWMYPYQRTPMGNPYISPIYPYIVGVYGLLSPRIPIFSPYKYHGYTVRGTPVLVPWYDGARVLGGVQLADAMREKTSWLRFEWPRLQAMRRIFGKYMTQQLGDTCRWVEVKKLRCKMGIRADINRVTYVTWPYILALYMGNSGYNPYKVELWVPI